jgi:N-acetyl-alpha-D-muramate 1-phosphate uridylyltransferase
VHDFPTVAILAGGLGTRLGTLAAEVPKAMMTVNGRPFLEHVLGLLAENGARRIVICRGHLGDVIEEGLGDGSRFGLSVVYSDEGTTPIGTAGALRQALPLLGERFMVLYGDTYLRVDYAAVADAHRQSGRAGLMTVLRNDGRWGESNASYSGGVVSAYNKRSPPPDAAWIDYGLLVLSARALNVSQEPDIADALTRLADAGQLTGVPVRRRFYEIGTPEALAETERFLRRVAANRAVRP